MLWLLPRALAAARMPASLPHHTCHWQAAAPKSIDPESDAELYRSPADIPVQLGVA